MQLDEWNQKLAELNPPTMRIKEVEFDGGLVARVYMWHPVSFVDGDLKVMPRKTGVLFSERGCSTAVTMSLAQLASCIRQGL